MRRERFIVACMTLIGLPLACIGCSDASALCDADRIRERLASATPGDVVSLGACTIAGAFEVPAGVTLEGQGVGETRITVPEGQVGLRLGGGGAGVVQRVADLEVTSAGCAGVVAIAGGAVELERVAVRTERGIGVGVEGAASLSMREVRIEGPIMPAAAVTVPLPPYDCATADPATHGLVVAEVPAAELSDVEVRGFAAFGALFLGARLSWDGGVVEDNVGAGLEVWGGAADLIGLELCGARQANAPVEAYNGVFGNGADITSVGLVACDGENFGLMHEGGVARHADLVARDNSFAGVWVQGGGALTMEGDATEIARNGFAGVAAVDASQLDLSDATIVGTRTRVALAGQTEPIEAADGVHLIRTTATLSNLVLQINERVGLLLDLGGESTDAVAIQGVTVTGEGEQLGAVAQNGTVNPGWDEGVDRDAVTDANDQALAEVLEIVGAVAPSCIPAPGALDDQGLASLLGL